MKRLLLVLSGALISVATFGQESETIGKTFWEDPVNNPILPLYLLGAFIVIVIALVVWIGIYMIQVLNMLTEQTKKEKAEKSGVPYIPSQTLWQRFAQKMNASVPVEQEKNIELHHSYDGIKELDNHLPPWWKWLFYGTIAWAVIYVVVFHFFKTLPLSEEEYRTEIALAEEQARQLKASQPQAIIDENTLEFTNDAALIEKGRSVFANNPCGSCHRPDGGGNTIGPNLTDDHWIHGGDVKSIFTTIKDGVVDKGMPAWGKAMSPQDLRDLTFYIISLRGSNPPDAKAPQGELYKPEPVTSDSTKQASL